MTEHLARHQLEELIENANTPLSDAVHDHLANCDHCTARKRAFTDAKARHLAASPASDFARAVIAQAGRDGPSLHTRARTWKTSRVYASAAGVLVAAAAVLLWNGPQPDSSEIRLKGGASLWAVAKHGAAQHVLRDGDTLAAGDQLAFEYALDRPRFLLLLGIDDGATVTRYFPAGELSSGRLNATTRAQLPFGIELDARAGEERLYALFSDEPLDETAARRALVRALNATRAGPHGGIEHMGELDLPAAQISLWFRKP